MKLTQNTILITGGSSGIGLELSKELLKRNNTVIICGRSKERLSAAKKQYPALEIIQCDVAKEEDCKRLVNWIKEYHPKINVLINNAAIVHKTNFFDTTDAIYKANQEIEVNFMGPLRLVHMLYSQLISNKSPMIINITTGLIYAPRADYPFYNSTKSALHSFTQVIRKQLEKSTIKVVEVMFPVVDTPWHKGSPPKIAITPQKAVEEMMKGVEKGKLEVRVGGVKVFYRLARIAPSLAFKLINNLEKS
ncbi:SDR family NAD(P)-dependent oxidoreductase [Tenacibaculum ascidiaceicola]|uniref:SDR family oxidoreductase n=1 Tax=Tenacibaculum ascidiaceicola TaxID=1699411 RepID=UPI0039E813C9